MKLFLEGSTLTLGELGHEYSSVVEAAETWAIGDQLHPADLESGLDWISNGEQRKAGYTLYLPGRFVGFSNSEEAGSPLSKTFVEEMNESNPRMMESEKAALLHEYDVLMSSFVAFGCFSFHIAAAMNEL
ncbi:MAG TPA: hypothetical protein VFF30_18025 [Nitrososphaerales archaeon]|nr:hypothetical protein [Nitrososphaerales archaeon]